MVDTGKSKLRTTCQKTSQLAFTPSFSEVPVIEALAPATRKLEMSKAEVHPDEATVPLSPKVTGPERSGKDEEVTQCIV